MAADIEEVDTPPGRPGLTPLLVWAVGALLAAVLAMAYLPLSQFPEMAELSEQPWPLSLLIVAGALAACAATWRLGRVVPRRLLLTLSVVSVFAVASAGAHLLYVYVFSHALPAGAAVAPGQTAPDFEVATSADGSGLHLSDLRQHRILLVFHRGHW